MPVVALVVALLSCAFVVSALVVGARELRALVPIVPRALARRLVVVMPARNEAQRLPATLRALLMEPHARVVVVDDRSSDDTVAVAERALLSRTGAGHVVTLVDEPPAGVFGKPRALSAGVEEARARGWLSEAAGPDARVLFLDADVVVRAGFLGGLVDAAERTGADALSGVPHLECQSLVEQMLVPALASVVTARFHPTRVHNADDDAAFLNGQVILVTVAALDGVGGWAAVSDTVLEDVALARKLKDQKRALRLADLRAVASTRMYDSLAHIDEGFGKNAVALLGKSAGVVGVASFLLACAPWFALALVCAAGRSASLALPIADVVAGALVVVTIGMQAAARRMAGAPVWPVLVLPLVYAGVAWVLVRASLRRRVSWRGRDYNVVTKGSP